MSNAAIVDLKAHARVLHRRVLARDPQAIQRLRSLPEFARIPDDELVQGLRRRHCLAAVSRQLGFSSWPHVKDVLSDVERSDFGTLLYPSNCQGHWNIWSAAYDEARAIRAAHGGFLLAYRRQFLIVDADFIDSMGLDPADADWERIARDWARPADLEARGRLYRQMIQNALVMLVLREAWFRRAHVAARGARHAGEAQGQ